jgi:predicted DNA binding protein
MSPSPHDTDTPNTPDARGEHPVLEDSLTEAGFEALPTQVAILDATGDIIYTNRAWRTFGEANDIDEPSHTLGVNYPAVCAGTDDEHAEQAFEGLNAVLDHEREEFSFEYPCHGPNEKRWFTMRAIRFAYGDDEFVLVLHLNITDRKLSELRVAAQNDELETLNQVNTVVRDVVDSLLEGVTREEVEGIVCERLVETHLYDSAFTVARGIGRDGVRVRTSAGLDADAVAEFDEDDFVESGIAAAIDTGEIHTVQYVNGDDDVPQRLRTLASESGFRSYAVVPLTYRDTVYGALVVNALRPDAFSDREQASFDLLGESVGYAINAIESKRVLYADTLSELTFDVEADEEFLVRAARETGAAFELEGLVPTGEGVTCYLHVDDAEPEAVVEYAREDDAVSTARVISDDGGLLECTLRADSTLLTLTEYGVTVVEATADGSGLRVVAVAAPETPVRDVVETVTAAVPGAELAAKRETKRTLKSVAGFRDQLTERLTDRQQEVLEAAYFGGYFKRPRESSGQELAEAFDLSAPTFHQHLQAGLHKLTGLAFDPPDD